MPSWLNGSGPEAIAEGREWLGGTPRGPGVVRSPPKRFGSSWEAFPVGRESHIVGREWSSGPHGGLGALPDGLDLSGSPPEGPGVVVSPSRRAGSGLEALPALLEELPTITGPPSGSPDHSRPYRRGYGPLLANREGLPTTLGPLRGPVDHFWTSRRACRSLPATPGCPGGPSDHSRFFGKTF